MECYVLQYIGILYFTVGGLGRTGYGGYCQGTIHTRTPYNVSAAALRLRVAAVIVIRLGTK